MMVFSQILKFGRGSIGGDGYIDSTPVRKSHRETRFTTMNLARIAGVVAIGVFASACSPTASTQTLSVGVASIEPEQINYATAYAAVSDADIELPAFDYTKLKERYLRQEVKYSGREPAGSIVVDTAGPFLYYVLGNRRAMRYGIAVGKEGFEWDGDTVVNSKQPWPTWTPPSEMIAREPSLKEFAGGMPPGITNPLGARALYLFKDGRDTMYRIHGTNRPFSIGKNASSGCFRMINQDVIDLYSRVSPGTKVKVRHGLPEQEFDGV